MLYLVKIFYAFIIPPGGIISLLILFNIYLYWKKIKGKYILSMITLLFYLLSTNFIAYHLVKPLENFYQNKTIEQLKQDKNDVIIMLGGGAINVADIDGEGQVSGYVANRMITVMRLQKNWIFLLFYLAERCLKIQDEKLILKSIYLKVWA